MKNVILSFLVVLVTSHAAAMAPKKGKYPITVHVSSSLIHSNYRPLPILQLDVTIDGRKYVLQDTSVSYKLIVLGDYPARLVKDAHPTAYEYSQTYQLLFPDGKTRDFIVVGQSE